MILIIDDDKIMAECIQTAVLNAAKSPKQNIAKDETQDASLNVAKSPKQNIAKDEKQDALQTVVKNTTGAKICSNAITAMQEISEGEMPTLIFLDILLDGPDGFTFLNELISYEDTAKIPVVIISSLDFAGQDLSTYGVVGILHKETMHPRDIQEYVKKYA